MLAHEGDVGSVQGGYNGHQNSLVFENLARHVGRVGMGYGIVHVQQVKLLALGDRNHHARQGKFIGLVLKKRVVLNLDLVKIEVLLKCVHASRHGLADYVNPVALAGKMGAEFGGKRPRAPKSGMAYDSDAHQSSKFFLMAPSWL